MMVKELQELLKTQNEDDEVYFEVGTSMDDNRAFPYCIIWFPKAEDFKFKTNYGGKDG